jgi:hypothetical protein
MEGRERWQKVETEMWGSDSKFDTSSCLFESASRAETIDEMGVRVEASEKAKETSEGFSVNQ